MRAAIATALLFVVALVLYGPGAPGYDASYAMVWGAQMAGGQLPDYVAPFAPTPHPLANLAAMPLSLLGDAGLPAYVLVVLVAYAALTWFAYLLGARLFSPAVGGLFALLVFTRTTLVNEALQGLVDIPFLTFVLAAGAVEAGDRARPRTVLVLLGLAGLLRPEAWPLAVLYVLWKWRREPQQRIAMVALAAAPPVIWVLSDLIVTGDPLYSLHGTRELAAALERPRGLVNALEAGPRYMRDLIEPIVGFAGLAGVLAGLTWLYRPTLMPATVGGLGLIGFLVLGAAGLPVLARYVLVPSIVLVLCCAVACLGWTALERDDPVRRPWMVVGALVTAAVAFSLLDTARDIRDLTDFTAQRRTVQADLHALSEAPEVTAALGRCDGLVVPEYQPVPLLAYWLDRSPTRFTVDPAPSARDAVVVAYARAEVGLVLSILPRRPVPPQPPPAGAQTLFSDASWTAWSLC
jgi:hypothetical protein